MRPTSSRAGALDAALAAAVLCACALIAWSIPSAGDYDVELRPAMTALLAGDLHAFAASAPVYAGSVWPRAPLSWVAQALGGGDLAVYRAGALAAVLAAGMLAFVLARRMRVAGRPALDRVAVAAVVLLAPVVLRALRDGHPEDVLAASLLLGAVLAALRDRPVAAGLALGLAVASKQWALLGVLPVLLAAPGRRGRLCAAAAGAAALAVLPVLALGSGRLAAQAQAAGQTGRLFHPQQLFWPLRLAHPNGGFTGPAWIAPLTHPLILVAGVVIPALWALRRRATAAPAHDVLLVLALVLLLRCALDPWNNAYYAVPLVFALAAWEALAGRGLPVLAIAVTALTWLSFSKLPQYVGWDALAALYLAWTVPLALALAVRLFAPQAMSSATAARTSPGPT